MVDVVRAVIDGGADAVEIGIPFSDPIMDGRTIQEASQRALDLGATPVERRSTQLAELDAPVPLIVMTYYNLVAHAGHERFARRRCATSGVDGAILPDLPLDELDGWGDAADADGVETVLLAAPTTTDERLARDLRAVAGLRLRRVAARRHRRTRASWPRTRSRWAGGCKAITDMPVLLGRRDLDARRRPRRPPRVATA